MSKRRRIATGALVLAATAVVLAAMVLSTRSRHTVADELTMPPDQDGTRVPRVEIAAEVIESVVERAVRSLEIARLRRGLGSDDPAKVFETIVQLGLAGDTMSVYDSITPSNQAQVAQMAKAELASGSGAGTSAAIGPREAVRQYAAKHGGWAFVLHPMFTEFDAISTSQRGDEAVLIVSYATSADREVIMRHIDGRWRLDLESGQAVPPEDY